jgi:hypothetical protein
MHVKIGEDFGFTLETIARVSQQADPFDAAFDDCIHAKAKRLK